MMGVPVEAAHRRRGLVAKNSQVPQFKYRRKKVQRREKIKFKNGSRAFFGYLCIGCYSTVQREGWIFIKIEKKITKAENKGAPLAHHSLRDFVATRETVLFECIRVCCKVNA